MITFWRIKMFGIEYLLALIKILINIGFAIVTAIPAKICWNCIAPKYLGFIPELYQEIPFWHIVAIFLVCKYLGEMIQFLTPTIVSVSQTNNNK